MNESARWNSINAEIDGTRAILQTAHRTRPLQIVMMTPHQATEAWLAWGRHGGSGKSWEQKDRHDLKRQLFGDPPRQLADKSQLLIPELIHQMQVNDNWPRTLKSFIDDLERFKGETRE